MPPRPPSHNSFCGLLLSVFALGPVNPLGGPEYLHKIAECVGWKLWDHALDHGPSVIKRVKNLVRVITYPDHATNKCPLCDILEVSQATLAEHFIIEHTKSDSS